MPNRAYELVDNNQFGRHGDALNALATQHDLPVSIATGFINLDGLNSLALTGQSINAPIRLMIGATPQPGELPGQPDARVIDHFTASVKNLRGERDFEAFPKERREKLDRVTRFIQSNQVDVRRYVSRFLHGKAYIFSETDVPSPFSAALVSSANLTGAGLNSNLELGMVQYQPGVVEMTLDWYRGLWDDAQDFKDELLDLLEPDIPETDPYTIFLRALYDYYGEDFDDQTPTDTPTLTSFQRDGYARARRILESHGGVLYADGVGMGKTEIGVEFVREFMHNQGQQVLVIAPAQLRDSLWTQRLADANLRTDIVSFQQLANDRQLSTDSVQRILPVDKDVYRLVVIDEAHAYRNSDNSWYIALDRLMSGTTKKLLMLTATPVNNSLWDLHNLFLLFARHDGAFADAPLRIPSLRKFFTSAGANNTEELSEPQLFPLIDALTVRRDRRFVVSRYRNERFKDGTRVVFPEPKLEERRYDLDDAYPDLVTEISKDIGALTMARYRHEAYLIGGQESASQETIAAFMQSMLLKRFESSWYAALKTTQRMTDAIERILASIKQHGVVPIGSAIEDVRIDADSGVIIQDELFEGSESQGDFISTDDFIDTFVKDLENDLSTLDDMGSRLKSLEGQSDPKLDTLRRVMANTPSQKVAIFSSFGDSVEYLVDRIKSDPSILNGRAWTSVIGGETDPNQRAIAVERFCPASESEAIDGSTTRPNDEVDVLISTDVLSEGQNLQQAQAVLSYDMPWNPQRVVQRNGRVIRLRSPHEVAFLYTLLPVDGALEKLLKLESNIQAKILAANASIGMESPVLQTTDAESRIFADLQNHTTRLATGDITLLDEEMNAAFAGEFFRSELMRAHQEGELQRIRELPWGIGAAFVPASTSLTEPAVFFACRTRNDERYWRMVSTSGNIMSAQDLEMMFHINPNGPGCDIPSDINFDQLFNIAADDIVEAHNQLTDPTALEGTVPASQRWALEILTSPDAPEGQQYDDAHAALSIGRNQRVRRTLSELRKEHTGGMTITETAARILKIVKDFGLAPVDPPTPPKPITPDDLGVVCYQVVIPPT